MKWRTDKPTADVIVAKLKYDTLPKVLKFNSYLHKYEMFGSVSINFDAIEKWADLEEDETVTDCHQLEEAAEEYARKYGKGAMGGAEYTKQDFIAGAEWQKQHALKMCGVDEQIHTLLV